MYDSCTFRAEQGMSDFNAKRGMRNFNADCGQEELEGKRCDKGQRGRMTQWTVLEEAWKIVLTSKVAKSPNLFQTKDTSSAP